MTAKWPSPHYPVCPSQATPVLSIHPGPAPHSLGRESPGTHLLKGAFVTDVSGPQEDPAVPETQLPRVGAAQVGEELPEFIIHPAEDREDGQLALETGAVGGHRLRVARGSRGAGPGRTPLRRWRGGGGCELGGVRTVRFCLQCNRCSFRKYGTSQSNKNYLQPHPLDTIIVKF